MNLLPRIFSPWELAALEIGPELILTVAAAGVMVMIAVLLAKMTD